MKWEKKYLITIKRKMHQILSILSSRHILKYNKEMQNEEEKKQSVFIFYNENQRNKVISNVRLFLSICLIDLKLTRMIRHLQINTLTSN